MRKKEKRLLLIVALDYEFEAGITYLLRTLQEERISHAIEYHEIGYVEMNIYLPINSVVTKDKRGLTIKWRDSKDETDISDHFIITNRMLLEMSMSEVTKID